MALLKEDNTFTHIIAIDFGTGASGYITTHLVLLLHLNNLIKMARFAYKSSILVMAVMTKRHQRLSFSTMTSSFWNLVLMLYKNTLRSSRMEAQLIFSKM